MMRQWNTFMKDMERMTQDMNSIFEKAFSPNYTRTGIVPYQTTTLSYYWKPQVPSSENAEMVYHLSTVEDNIQVEASEIKVQSREAIGITTVGDEDITRMALQYKNRSGVLGLNVNEHEDVVYPVAMYIAKAIKGDESRHIIFVDGPGVAMQYLRNFKDPIVVVRGKPNFHVSPWKTELNTAYYQMFSKITVIVLNRELDSDYDSNVHSLSLWTPQVDTNPDKPENGVYDKDDAAREDDMSLNNRNPYENDRGHRYL